MITLNKVSKTYKHTRAVEHITLNIEEGENIVLLGTSGCGKTTTLRMINRLIEPTEGAIIVNGKNILHHSPENLRRGIGYVLQHNGLFPHFTVAENIAVVPKLLKWNTATITNRIDELLHKLHLNPREYLHAYPHQLSGGQQQRVGLARALAADPPILLMDEPFGALDPITRQTIRKDFTSLEDLKRKTIVMVTHDIGEAFEIGDRICLMDKGKIKQVGTPAQLLFKPANNFVQSFLKEDRLMLELQAFNVSDIIDYLPQHPQQNQAVEVSERFNGWDLLQMLSSKNDINIYARNSDPETAKHLTIETLFAAYNKLKLAVT